MSSAVPVSLEPFLRALDRGRRRARAQGRRILVSYAEPVPHLDPLAVYAAARPGTVRLFWHHQHRLLENAPQQTIAGIGVTQTLQAEGAGRFDAIKSAWCELRSGAVVERSTGDAPAWGAGPLLLGGFSFDPLHPATDTWQGFPDARFTLPRFGVAGVDGSTWLTTNVLVDAGTDCQARAYDITRERQALIDRARSSGAATPAGKENPAWLETPGLGNGRDIESGLIAVDTLPAEDWQALVERTANEIRQGQFAKVVLARQARVAAPEAPFDATATLAALRTTYAGGFIFAFTFPEACSDRTFLGATPERLVHLHDRVVETSSLAGSIRRGATPVEDFALGTALLDDEKERTEHAVVADMLRQALAPLCSDLSVPFPPILLRLANVQHLFTPIRGTLRNGQTILDLVERLHPTPAVGGFPRREALAVIREREQLDRGWYAGPVGWLDENDEGEFAVAIRSALLDGIRREALLFAGCGIVAHSNATAEYAESRLKMQAMLSALR
jgi:isochorismate synthase